MSVFDECEEGRLREGSLRGSLRQGLSARRVNMICVAVLVNDLHGLLVQRQRRRPRRQASQSSTSGGSEKEVRN